MSWKENISTIKEIFPGQYQVILDFATNEIVEYLINDDINYVWVYNHRIDMDVNWESQYLPISKNKSVNVLNRKVTFDFILPTSEFKQLIPHIKNGITLSQINHLPKSYLDPNKIKGKTWYELLLKECDYLFEVHIPSATDYGELISPDRNFLQSLLDKKEIDWSNLP